MSKANQLKREEQRQRKLDKQNYAEKKPNCISQTIPL